MNDATTLNIAGRTIGAQYPPFIIAEMSGNHNQSLQRALKMVDAAAAAGVDAIKLQTLDPDTITLDVTTGDFIITDDRSPWQGRHLHELYQQACTAWSWHATLMQHAQARGLICFSTPFDEAAVDFLQSLDVPAYKIASFENNHLALIKKVAQTDKPVLISTGMASRAELDEAVQAARDGGCRQLALLKCTSQYPASAADANLRTLGDLRKRYDCVVGLSDHSRGLAVPLAAIALGACVIEKHFTLARADGGVDSQFSLEPDELKTLVVESHRAWRALGHVFYGATDSEQSSRVFRRSIYIAKDLQSGDRLTRDNLRIVRPGMGLAPKYYDRLLGLRVRCAVKKGQPMQWDLLTEEYRK